VKLSVSSQNQDLRREKAKGKKKRGQYCGPFKIHPLSFQKPARKPEWSESFLRTLKTYENAILLNQERKRERHDLLP
jgi:hypothetical protein